MLTHYQKDFSICVKELLMEKLEDMRDIQAIRRIKEGKREDYLRASEIDRLFSKTN